jgi:hypothetical protein
MELFFDRIQDLWIGFGNTPTVNYAAKYGVQWDIWALERLCGVFGLYKGGDPSGPPITAPMNIWCGGNNNQASVHMSALITGLDYTYDMFDSNMVPSLATVDLTFVQILNPNANITNTGKPITVTNITPSTSYTAGMPSGY